MALKSLSKTGIATGQTIEALQVSQSVDAFTGIQDYQIKTSGSLLITGSTTITGSLLISSSGAQNVASLGKTGIGEYFTNGGTSTNEFTVSGSGVLNVVLESSDNTVSLKLAAPDTKTTLIDFEEGGNNRWIIGNYASDDSFAIASGSSLGMISCSYDNSPQFAGTVLPYSSGSRFFRDNIYCVSLLQ